VIVLSLLPMLWASGAGAEILRPMSAPVLGESSSQTRSSTCRFQCSSIGCARRACRA
jgi:hypothetical protein